MLGVAKLGNRWFLLILPGQPVTLIKVSLKTIRNTYYKVLPEEMIASHMPYDYLWQFLSYPITNTEFETGKLLPVKPKVF
jgi:transglutaminase/protease-like cytokinesis protein 3